MTVELPPATAFVLAGGLGTRLRDAVPDVPKVLAPVGGRPFLHFLLDRIASAGIRRVVLCTGYRAGEVRRAVGSARAGMEVAYSVEEEPAGTGGAVRLAFSRFAADPLLVMNGDSCCRADLPAFFRWHAALRPTASLVLARSADTRRFGRVELDRSGSVVRFTEKGDQGGEGWINAGIYLLPAHMVRSIAPSGAVSLERDVIAPLAGRGLAAWPCPGSFLDIGTRESYQEAEAFFAADGAPLPGGGA